MVAVLDLQKFLGYREAIVPIVGGIASYSKRKLVFKNVEDGFYLIELTDTAKVLRPATLFEKGKALKDKKKFLVYSLGTEGVPTNFDIFNRRGLGLSVHINFLNSSLFSTAVVTQWEDGRFYFTDDSYFQAPLLGELKKAFEGRAMLTNIKGITPELRYYFLLCGIQAESYDALRSLQNLATKSNLSKEEIEKRIKGFQNGFKGRLDNSVQRAGGKLIRFSKRGQNFLVEWQVGNQIIKSLIKDNLRVVSAGYCLSGEDEKHTLNSLINLAKYFQESSPLYITRD